MSTTMIPTWKILMVRKMEQKYLENKEKLEKNVKQ